MAAKKKQIRYEQWIIRVKALVNTVGAKGNKTPVALICKLDVLDEALIEMKVVQECMVGCPFSAPFCQQSYVLAQRKWGEAFVEKTPPLPS